MCEAGGALAGGESHLFLCVGQVHAQIPLCRDPTRRCRHLVDQWNACAWCHAIGQGEMVVS